MSVQSKIENMISAINLKTNGSYTDLTSATQELMNGYGQGGVPQNLADVMPFLDSNQTTASYSGIAFGLLRVKGSEDNYVNYSTINFNNSSYIRHGYFRFTDMPYGTYTFSVDVTLKDCTVPFEDIRSRVEAKGPNNSTWFVYIDRAGHTDRTYVDGFDLIPYANDSTITITKTLTVDSTHTEIAIGGMFTAIGTTSASAKGGSLYFTNLRAIPTVSTQSEEETDTELNEGAS